MACVFDFLLAWRGHDFRLHERDQTGEVVQHAVCVNGFNSTQANQKVLFNFVTHRFGQDKTTDPAAHSESTALSSPQLETMPAVSTLESRKSRTRYFRLNVACSAALRCAPGTLALDSVGRKRALAPRVTYQVSPWEKVGAARTRMRWIRKEGGSDSALGQVREPHPIARPQPEHQCPSPTHRDSAWEL
jgi:hypothetical protein